MTVPNVRLFPPSSGARPSITANGRSYSCAQNSTIDVPQHDAQVMLANGWTKAADEVGTTAQRQAKTGQPQGYLYHDTTLNVTVAWEGAAWRNPVTGASV